MERRAGAEAEGAGDAEAKTTGRRRGAGVRRATEGRETGSLGDGPPAKTERQQGAGEERSPEARAGRGAQGLGARGPADGSQEATVILSGVADKQGEPLECPTTLRDPDPLDLVGRPRGPTGGGGLLHLPALAPGAQTLSTTVAPREASPSSQLTQTQGAPTLP